MPYDPYDDDGPMPLGEVLDNAFLTAGLTFPFRNTTLSADVERRIVSALPFAFADEELNEPDRKGYTPLHKAAALGSVVLARRLLEAGAWMTLAGGEAQSPLMMAAANGHTHVVALLVEYGANPNEGALGMGHALHAAAEGGHLVMAQTLLDLKADPTAQDQRKRTPVDVARSAQHVVMANTIEKMALTSFSDMLSSLDVEPLSEKPSVAASTTPAKPRRRL